ncbi:MAG: tetratricopeptide repeat protein [Planctomycetes bacterium]|nr:tetratricopeptide repeat protein [Planctomycetota bacterium]
MKCKKAAIGIFVVTICLFLSDRTANCAGRRIGIGKQMPEFSASNVSGKIFDYKHGNGKVLVAVFLSSRQKHSTQAATDIKRIMSKLSSQANRLSVVVAVDDPNNQTFVQSDLKGSEPNKSGVVINIVADTEYKLWGKFGIIATPTVIISDTNDTVLWVKAGHGYDFAPVVQARLNQALGIAQEIDPNEAGHVRTVTNSTLDARAKRHLQMAKMLHKKGRIESAIEQMRKARELDPNSVELALEIGNLLCSIGQSKSALEILEGVKTRGNIEKSKLLIITGWAKRQMNNFDEAEKLLLEATKLNSKSGRAFFELGQIYQAKGEAEKAMLTYYQALTLVFSRELDISNLK